MKDAIQEVGNESSKERVIGHSKSSLPGLRIGSFRGMTTLYFSRQNASTTTRAERGESRRGQADHHA